MLFHTALFFGFFSIVFVLYWLLRRRVWQNVLLLAASYVFYGAWDWRFLGLLWVSTIVDFTVGLLLGRTDEGATGRRRLLLFISLATNLGILGFFKYYDFFVDSLVELGAWAGIGLSPARLGLILPVGISFYTFQTLSYTIDIYRDKMRPTRSLLDFALFVAFFPQLVAGPIERASRLLPQIGQRRTLTWEMVDSGVFLFFWGLIKKMVVADNAALVANRVFENYTDFGGVDIILGVLAFAIQIYGDFSGYSDMARGVARLLGFELMVNFRLPYFAVSPSDFWRRWHISLSTWLRDYLYIPLGGNRKGPRRMYVNLFLTMLLGGLWHGAAWNFVLWGAFHGAILIVYRVVESPRTRRDPRRTDQPRWRLALRMTVMFLLTLLGWLIFRATSLEQIGGMLASVSLTTSGTSGELVRTLVVASLPLLILQPLQAWRGDLLVWLRLRPPLRVITYGAALGYLFLYSVREQIEFIYFQF